MTVKQLIAILQQFDEKDAVSIFTSRYRGGGDEWAEAESTPVVLTTEYGGVYLTPDFEEDAALHQLGAAMKVD